MGLPGTEQAVGEHGREGRFADAKTAVFEKLPPRPKPS